jgi:membrane peptidoglycan carboxypeptidase
LIREIRNASGATAFRPNPEQRRVISKETANALRGMLEGVTLNGTARKAQLDGYSAAGKTGTAQKIDPRTGTYSKTKYVASFVGFAPVNNPAVVIIVVIDEPGGAYHGGDVAAPVFRQIAEQILPDMGVMPDTDFKNPNELVAGVAETPEQLSNMRKAQKLREKETRREESRASTLPQVAARDNRGGEIVYAVATNKAILMPDLRGRSVRDVARTCSQLGMQLEAHGEGRVIRQTPGPGMELLQGRVIYVDFGRPN